MFLNIVCIFSTGGCFIEHNEGSYVDPDNEEQPSADPDNPLRAVDRQPSADLDKPLRAIGR